MTEAGKTVIFLGPTLPRAECPPLPGCQIAGPAAMGDITRAVHEKASAIVLVDGVFESGPSVWHKEILWALSLGIPVIGCSSMGALRAAELQSCGMVGYGRVFEDYKSGVLEDDDEVAVLHGPAETGWLPLTDAMVDIREHVAHALREGLLALEEAEDILHHAKSQHFKERSLKGSLAAMASRRREPGLRPVEAHWLENLPRGCKAQDCLSLFSCLDAVISEAWQNLGVVPAFLPTVYLSRLEKFGFKP